MIISCEITRILYIPSLEVELVVVEQTIIPAWLCSLKNPLERQLFQLAVSLSLRHARAHELLQKNPISRH